MFTPTNNPKHNFQLYKKVDDNPDIGLSLDTGKFKVACLRKFGVIS